eukprot:552762_1
MSTIALFAIFRFNIISHMDFYQKSIQMAIHMDHSNQFRYIHPIISHTKQLNNHFQLSQTFIQKTTKIDQATNAKWKYGVIDVNNNHNNVPPPPQHQPKLLTSNLGGNVSAGFGLF